MTTTAPPRRPAAPADAAQRRILLVLVVAQVVGTVGVGVAPSVGVLLAEEVTDSETWAGLARTASTLGAALVGLPLGALAARHGRRTALATGWLAAAGGAALLVGAAQWSSALLLFPGLLLIGVGSAVALQSRFAATDRALPEHRGRALALVVWVGTLGSVVGPNLGVPGAWISAATGLTVYASAFLVAAVALSAAGLVVAVALRPDPLAGRTAGSGPRRAARPAASASAAPTAPAAPTGEPAPSAPTVEPVPSARRRPFAGLATALRGSVVTRTAAAAIVSAQVVMVSIMTMTPVHMHHHGGSVTIVGLTISLHVAGMYALAPVVGVLADRRGARAAVAVGLVVLAVALLLAAALPLSTPGLVAALVLLGVGWSFVNVAGSTLFAQSLAADDRAPAQGGIDAVTNLCAAVAAFASGPLLALTGFPVLAGLALLALVPLAVLVTRPRRWA